VCLPPLSRNGGKFAIAHRSKPTGGLHGVARGTETVRGVGEQGFSELEPLVTTLAALPHPVSPVKPSYCLLETKDVD
jgi:hypothetical protein